ncbi:ubiquitin-conjugating enzyme E2-binding protein [Mucor mucedo]|uniref:ubiquitin-conjugating enzyme E2-binding protein n=1 Tax=Mucor mucedo TaxID=29922 RepID=UPI002220C89D|nr:ubiquitin-conjugating enzyme E2-binding protein [Mucor mucedo]KAI7896441.1 ubiquitin-conjugating enzyme E2-binding protein [Mucor mucedo]
MIPFYAEELGNINVLRASISTEPSCNVSEVLSVSNNAIMLKDQLVADLNAVQVEITTDNLVVAQPPSIQQDKSGLFPWEIKLYLAKAPAPLRSQQAEVKEWWTSKLLLGGAATCKKEIHCQHCDASILDNSVEYKIKDLPSEHWYELVECWICHETKPEEHQARMRPILARPNLLLVGTSYFLIHPDNLLKDSVQVDKMVLDRTNWDRGTFTKWIAVNCSKCKNVIGEGQYCVEDDALKLLAVKIFKYCITIVPALPEHPEFTDYLVSDLINTAKIHATHRFLIQGRQSQNIYALIWLFNWDTNIIYNNGYTHGSSSLKRERGNL